MMIPTDDLSADDPAARFSRLFRRLVRPNHWICEFRSLRPNQPGVVVSGKFTINDAPSRTLAGGAARQYLSELLDSFPFRVGGEYELCVRRPNIIERLFGQ